MNKIMEAQKRKLKEVCTITQAIEGLSDELYEKRKNDDDVLFQLKNIAGSLDFISQYLYDISWELKKNREEIVDKIVVTKDDLVSN